MSERRVAVASAVGLHARPASLFARAAADTGLTDHAHHHGRQKRQRGKHPRSAVPRGRLR